MMNVRAHINNTVPYKDFYRIRIVAPSIIYTCSVRVLAKVS